MQKETTWRCHMLSPFCFVSLSANFIIDPQFSSSQWSLILRCSSSKGHRQKDSVFDSLFFGFSDWELPIVKHCIKWFYVLTKFEDLKNKISDYSGVIKWRKKELMHLWDYNGIDFWLIHKINTIEQSIWQSAKRKRWNEITLQNEH